MSMKTKLLELRKQKNILQKDVAMACGISTRTYGSYESDEREPSIAMLNLLADYFNVTVDELLGRPVSHELFDEARIPKTKVQELFDQLTVIDQGRILGKMEVMIEQYHAGDIPKKNIRR